MRWKIREGQQEVAANEFEQKHREIVKSILLILITDTDQAAFFKRFQFATIHTVYYTDTQLHNEVEWPVYLVVQKFWIKIVD